VLTGAQGDAVLAELDKAVTTAVQRADETRAEGESGIVAGVLDFFDLDHTSQLDAQAGAASIMAGAVQRLRSDLPAAVADPQMGARWLDAARSAAAELASLQSDITEATIEDTIAKTATATGTQVKEGINLGAGSAARLLWASIPWWVLAAGVVGLGAYGYVTYRRVA
jgi:hypothetical protein